MEKDYELKRRYSLREISINYALDIIRGKWKLPILWEISKEGSIRFNELQRSLGGISSLMLTRSLKELTDKKIVLRVQYNEIPPHVEYSLTELGRGLCPILNTIEKWGIEVMEVENKS